MVKAKKSDIDLEKALSELDKLISEMERGGLPLEKSLEHFEKGIALARQSQDILKAAEQKVQILLNKNNEVVLQPYEDDEESD